MNRTSKQRSRRRELEAARDAAYDLANALYPPYRGATREQHEAFRAAQAAAREAQQAWEQA